MIRFTNYNKSFGNNTIISIPQLELAHGVYWLKGENGSGKTTLIKSIAGLIPFDGSISVTDTDIRKQRMQYRALVNYTEAEPMYPGFLTGNDMIRFYAKTKQADDKQVQSLTDAFGIGGYAGNKIGTYSSGMAKKLSLALGFLGQPRLILLDEPLITLDAQSVKTLQQLIGDYYTAGAAFLITSHQEISFETFSPSRLLVKDKTVNRL